MFGKNKNKSLEAIIVMNAVQEFALSFIGVFLPIYFLVLGHELKEVFLFFIVNYFFVLVFAFLAIYISNRIGTQNTIIIRLPFLFLFLASLIYVEYRSFPIYIIAFFNALQTALYFTPLHILFTQNTKLKSIGSSMGKYFALSQLGALFGPILGGIIVWAFGFSVLFSLVIVILIFSIWPLRKMKPVGTSFKFEWRRGIKLFKKYPKYFWAEVWDNFGEEAHGILWPIFIYLFFNNVLSVGVTGSLIGAGSFIFTLLIGKVSDKYKKEQLLKIAAVSLFVLWIARFGFSGAYFYYATTVIAGFLITFFAIPFHSLIFSIAKKNTVDEFIVFREVPVAIGRLLFFFIALFFISHLKFLFPLAGLAYLYFLFL